MLLLGAYSVSLELQGFTIGYIAYLYFSWFYLYLVNVRGFSITHGGLYGSLPFVTAALVAPLAHHFGWDGALYASAGLAVIGALFWFGVHPGREIDFHKVDAA